MSSSTSVVIVNWNRLDYLKDCLASLRGSGAGRLEIIVVDNGSSDGSVEYLRGQPDVVLVANSSNEGYAPANNAGIARASGDYVLLLNNDTRVRAGFLQPLLRVLDDDPGVGGCQCKLLTYDVPPVIDGLGSYLTWTGLLYHYKYGHPDEPAGAPFEIFAAKGAAFIIRRSLLQRVGAFDGDFFAYLEDSDLSWRIWLSGSRVLCVPESVVFHRGGVTASTLPTEFVTFHSFKNRLSMLLKNPSRGTLARILPIHLLMLGALIVAHLARREGAQARGVVRALLWSGRHLGATWRKRQTVQAMRRVPDRELLPRIVRAVRPSYYYYLMTGLPRYHE